MKLFVNGIPENYDDRDLREMFELYGPVESARVIMDRATRRSKGFGFVDFVREANAKEAMELLDGTSVYGRPFTVKIAEERT
jgi:RNA recognition motif-containing protein